MKRNYLVGGLGIVLGAVSSCGNQTFTDPSWARMREACDGVIDPSVSLNDGLDALVTIYRTARDEGIPKRDVIQDISDYCGSGDLIYSTAAECTACNIQIINYVYDD